MAHVAAYAVISRCKHPAQRQMCLAGFTDWESMTNEELAAREGEQNAAEDRYFDARGEFAGPQSRRIFCAGFQRGWDAAVARNRPALHQCRFPECACDSKVCGQD